MQTLQSKLCQLRNWQHKTLLKAASDAEMDVRKLAKIEARYPVEGYVDPTRLAYERIAKAYGMHTEVFTAILAYHFGRGMREHSFIPPLPEVARQHFKTGNFCVLDCETTGKDPHAEETEIVEIAILDEDGLPLLDTFIRPTRAIPGDVMELHGITDEMVASAPTFSDIYPQIVAAIEGKTVIVYNADYDIYLLDNLINRNKLEMPRFDQYCLMRAYANYLKRPGLYGNYAWIKLSEACELQGVEAADAHRAMGDTIATFSLLKTLANK